MKACAVSHLLTLSSAAITLLLPPAVFAQGDLPPPAGAPVPTMKSLDQIEPRKPLIARSAGVSIGPTGTITITEAGSYYLTGNLTVSTGNGIVIEKDDVSLDLRGFTIASDAAPNATGDAISFSGERSRISIANGHIRSGVTHLGGDSFSNGPGFDSGINWPGTSPHSVRVSGMSIAGVKSFGIDLGTDASCIVQACTVRVAGEIGIRAGVVSDCSVTLGGFTTISAARVANSVGSRADGTGTGIESSGATTDGLQAALTQIQADNQLLAGLLSASTVPFAWNLTTVDSAGDVGKHTSLAFGPNGQPAISYYDTTNGNLKLARYYGTTWITSTVDNSAGDVGSYTSLAFGPDGQPAISYYDTTNGNLKFTRFTGSSWTNVTVDNSAGNVGLYTSLAFGPDGQPAISYRDVTGQNLNLARYNGAWTITAVDSTGNVGEYTSLAFGPDGQPAISYFSQTNYDLKLARFDGSTWVPVIINGDAFIGQHTSLAFGPDGHPAISCQIVTSETLSVARYNGNAWATTGVDGTGATGLFTSLAFGPDGQPAVSYYFSSTGDLRYARYNGTAWTTTTVEGDGTGSGMNVGAFTSLAFGPDGQPAISYYDTTNGNLKFARKGIFRSSP